MQEEVEDLENHQEEVSVAVALAADLEAEASVEAELLEAGNFFN
jgi:hypothetical protein